MRKEDMTCLRRTDPNKDIFKRPIYKRHQEQKRVNHYNLVDLEDNILYCNKKGNYSILDLGNDCELKNGNIIQLHVGGYLDESQISLDYSFWSGSGRCIHYKDEYMERSMVRTFKYNNLVYDKLRFQCVFYQTKYKHALFCDKTNAPCGLNELCPNSTLSIKDCSEEHQFFCNKSKTCILKGKKFQTHCIIFKVTDLILI